jgi:hypothetical protein
VGGAERRSTVNEQARRTASAPRDLRADSKKIIGWI